LRKPYFSNQGHGSHGELTVNKAISNWPANQIGSSSAKIQQNALN